MKVKEETEKVVLNLNIQKTTIMASGPITSWQIDGEEWKQCQTLFWGAPKSLKMVTAAMKLTRYLFLGRKSVTNLHSMLKSRDIPFFIKGLSSQSYGFSNRQVWI